MKRNGFLVNDYAGHPFQIELSSALARSGYATVHAYCATNVTPRGDLTVSQERLTIVPISTGAGFDKYNARRRLVAEIRYGAHSVRALASNRPAACLNANVPIISLAMITVASKVLRVRNVLWLQDLQAGLVALALGRPDHPIALAMRWLERWCVRSADHVVAISTGFEDEVRSIGVAAEDVTTISNWAPIDELPVLPRDSAWAREHGLESCPVLLYSGSMGIKHRPEALAALASELEHRHPEARLVVVSQGVGADWLANEVEARSLGNVVLLPFQDFERLPEVLASADVLLALLEPDAGEFSVPSKVLSYLCAARAVVGLMPANNAASRMLTADANAGLVSDDEDGFVKDCCALLEDPERRADMAHTARQYAERHFDIDVIANRFLAVLGETRGSCESGSTTNPTQEMEV